jgi:hypothetical protein
MLSLRMIMCPSSLPKTKQKMDAKNNEAVDTIFSLFLIIQNLN